MVNNKAQEETLSKLYEGREEVLAAGIRVGPMKIIKIQKILRRDLVAWAYYKQEIGKGRTADQITVEELELAGVKERTIRDLSSL